MVPTQCSALIELDGISLLNAMPLCILALDIIAFANTIALCLVNFDPLGSVGADVVECIRAAHGTECDVRKE